MAKLNRFLDQENLKVIYSLLSNFHEQQAWNRKNLTNYFEVYLEVPYEVFRLQDKNGLYSGVESGRLKNAVDADIPFKPPLHPDLILFSDRSGNQTVNKQADKIMEGIIKKKSLSK